MEPAERQEKEELDKPAKTLSEMLSNSKIASTHSSIGIRSKIPAARPEILLMPYSCFTSIGGRLPGELHFTRPPGFRHLSTVDSSTPELD